MATAAAAEAAAAVRAAVLAHNVTYRVRTMFCQFNKCGKYSALQHLSRNERLIVVHCKCYANIKMCLKDTKLGLISKFVLLEAVRQKGVSCYCSSMCGALLFMLSFEVCIM
jgi:hypothetical protein